MVAFDEAEALDVMTRKYHDMAVLKWDGLKLRLTTGRLLATVEPDSKHPGMYRVRMKGGELSDMVNLSRAKDAARSLAMAALNLDARQTPVAASPMRPILEAAECRLRPERESWGSQDN